MSTPAPRNRRAKLAVVRRTERITPHMIRVVLSCDEYADNGMTDHYVKLLFPKAGVDYPEPLDMGIVRETFPADQWPVMRTYTVRSWDEAAAELTIDFVHHGDEGVAGPWAANAQPGDKLWFSGPGGGYTADPAADWHLLVGDESALPAIGSAIEQLPAGARAKVYVEVEDESDEQKFGGSEGIELTWFHRAGVTGERGDQLVRQWSRWSSRPVRCTHSCTARPDSCSGSAATCSRIAACPVRRCRFLGTGVWVRTKTAGRPRRPTPPARNAKNPPRRDPGYQGLIDRSQAQPEDRVDRRNVRRWMWFRKG